MLIRGEPRDSSRGGWCGNVKRAPDRSRHTALTRRSASVKRPRNAEERVKNAGGPSIVPRRYGWWIRRVDARSLDADGVRPTSVLPNLARPAVAGTPMRRPVPQHHFSPFSRRVPRRMHLVSIRFSQAQPAVAAGNTAPAGAPRFGCVCRHRRAGERFGRPLVTNVQFAT